MSSCYSSWTHGLHPTTLTHSMSRPQHTPPQVLKLPENADLQAQPSSIGDARIQGRMPQQKGGGTGALKQPPLCLELHDPSLTQVLQPFAISCYWISSRWHEASLIWLPQAAVRAPLCELDKTPLPKTATALCRGVDFHPTCPFSQAHFTENTCALWPE